MVKRRGPPGEDLFSHQAARDPALVPLAERMRPNTLEELIGQEDILGPGRLLRVAIERDRIPSMILWGPPGSGKTTLARVLAGATKAWFEALSAVGSGVADLRRVIAAARERRALSARRTILFIDEIHRFNKAQQDALLPHVESGELVLVGATTENPSFEVNAALLSRVRVFRLRGLSDEEVGLLLTRAMEDGVRGLGGLGVEAEPGALDVLARGAAGDVRRGLAALEAAALHAAEGGRLTLALAQEALQGKVLLYDKAGEEHYNVISAFIKSLRGSDPDGAVYYMVRMLEAGEDPVFIMRRMVIFASEDVGNADPAALGVAVHGLEALRLVGLPEAVLAMTQVATYLACAPKSNSSLKAYMEARKDIQAQGALPVPLRLRNAPTSLMKVSGYGRGYRYPHDFEGHYVPETYLPEALEGRVYYHPSDSGHEARLKARLQELRELRAKGERS